MCFDIKFSAKSAEYLDIAPLYTCIHYLLYHHDGHSQVSIL